MGQGAHPVADSWPILGLRSSQALSLASALSPAETTALLGSGPSLGLIPGWRLEGVGRGGWALALGHRGDSGRH